MSAVRNPPHRATTSGQRPHRADPVRRLTTETKAAFKTTEFFAFVAMSSAS